jgi:hypothetical protein
MDKENRIKRRPRSDTAVRRLTPEQRAKVDGWLFDEQFSYAEVVLRCEKELGLALSKVNVGRYCRQEQANGRRRNASERSQPVQDGGSCYVEMLESMSRAAQRAAGQIEIRNDPRMLVEFARVLTAARQEANQALRATTTREKFEFDAATACLVHQVGVQNIVEDEALDDGQRILKIRTELFGPDLPE